MAGGNIFLVRPSITGQGWVAVAESLVAGAGSFDGMIRTLYAKLRRVEIWFSDMDDFDIRSPAKIMAKRAVGTSYFSPEFFFWCIHALFRLLSSPRRETELFLWEEYYNRFLKQNIGDDWLNERAFRKIETLMTPRHLEKWLYPGVLDFYDLLNAEKILVTRNIDRIAYRYNQFMPFREYHHEVKDKARFVAHFIEKHSDLVYYGNGGDSEDDAEVAELLQSYYRKGRIGEPVSLQRALSPHHLDNRFNLFVGKDRRNLVEILKTPVPALTVFD